VPQLRLSDASIAGPDEGLAAVGEYVQKRFDLGAFVSSSD
jgi:hypothetical protein